MFFSKVVLLAISLGALSVLATPHALHHHALHRRAVAARAVAARVASPASNSSDVSARRRSSPKCIDRSAPPPSSSSSSIPVAATPVDQNKPPVVPPVTPTPTPTPTPTQTPHQQPAPPSTTSTTPPPSTTPPSTGGGGGGSGGGGGGNNGPFTGDGTFFSTGLGACGTTNVDTDFIVAVSLDRFDAVSTGNSNTNPLCGRKVQISFGGATAIATIVDRCTGCAEDSLDMTPSLFQVFAALSVGRIHGIRWNFL